MTITADVGLTVFYNGVYNIFVEVAADQYEGKLSGLCGNFNGDKADDLTTKNGADSAVTFGNSWNVDPKCPPANEVPNSCTANSALANTAKLKCSLLKEPPFDKCNEVLNPITAHITNCEYDVCTSDDPTASACEAYAAYSEDCAVYGKIIDWKNDAKFSKCRKYST